jgi:hypothetical protein
VLGGTSKEIEIHWGAPCVVSLLCLGIDPEASAFRASGMKYLFLSPPHGGHSTNDSPINAVPGTTSTFTGALYANATTPCPTSYADWATLLPTLTLSTTSGYASYQGVQL